MLHIAGSFSLSYLALALIMAADGLPFGGVGGSGCKSLSAAHEQYLTPSLDGAHTGKYTFDTFTHLRSSLDSPSW